MSQNKILDWKYSYKDCNTCQNIPNSKYYITLTLLNTKNLLDSLGIVSRESGAPSSIEYSNPIES